MKLIILHTKRGRPRSEEPGSMVGTWLKQSEHDRLIQFAQREQMTVSALVRRLLVPRLPQS